MFRRLFNTNHSNGSDEPRLTLDEALALTGPHGDLHRYAHLLRPADRRALARGRR